MANPNDLDITKLGERKQDIFFDIIHSDYVKILKEIEKKKKRQGFQYDTGKQQGKNKPKLVATNNNTAQRAVTGDQDKDQAGAQFNKRDPPDFGGKNQKKPDTSPYIDEGEFLKINFDLDWPLLIKDLAKFLTGSDILKSNNRIMEADELNNQQQGEDLCKDNEINDYKGRMTTIT